MPAFRGINLRSGDLAEQLGILLLQSVALVAPIPRTEDVGIDVVSTLIKKYDGYKYIAEDSFFVSIKSASITEVSFEGDQVKWLKDLQLPLFIATVDRRTSTIKLYTTQGMSVAFASNSEIRKINFQLMENYDGELDNVDEELDLPIGPPVLKWTLNDIETKPNFVHKFYDLMKIHVTIAKKSIETKRIGYVDLMVWKTGKVPKVWAQQLKFRKDNLAVDEISAPYFQSILHNLSLGNEIETTRSLYRLFDKVLNHAGHFHIVNGVKELKPLPLILKEKATEDTDIPF
ncbi:hypothetical protein [Pedobacter chitinilyticus]|uniref:Uncharacterized protein n=1 Tax=Pedobacter chitinilyticus TaxID=2233776 RepID=A0A3S3STJ6_9SPHI|nr:hypothetical protein [Pedobacter chitinilyticus]RWU10066.1 hypothetical protein DPV69_01610 [Pedobacter chitinilyticus]